jgi:hypothetical protein
MVLYTTPSLQRLDISNNILGSAGFAELAQALHHNTSIKELDMSFNGLQCMESARLLRDILRNNKTMLVLDLSGNTFGQTTGAVECIADAMLGSNSRLLKINLSYCALGYGGISTLAQTIGSRSTTLQKLTLVMNIITSTGVGVLLETMEQSSCHITDFDLQHNPIGNEGANLLARSLGNHALPCLTRLSLSYCGIGDDGLIALVSALEQNTSLLHLNLRSYHDVSERAFLALADNLPEIKVLQRVDLGWCPGLASAMPLLLVGLRKNKSLFRFHVTGCAPALVPPTTEDTAKSAGGWMQDMERVGYRRLDARHGTCGVPKLLSPFVRCAERGATASWCLALCAFRVATLPDVIFEVLRSKPSLVPSEDTGGTEAAKDTDIP